MRLPPYVVRARDKFRGWVSAHGRRVYGPSRVTAHEAYEDALRLRERLAGGSELTLAAACDLVLEETRAKRTAGTVSWYSDHFAVLRAEFGDATFLCDITPERIEQWVADRRADVKPATINADLRALHRVYTMAIRRGLTTANPVRRVDRPREDRPAMDYFDEAELAQIISQVDEPRAQALFVFLYYTGLRRSELARLQPEHVRRTAVTVAGKNATRVVPLSPDVAAFLDALALPLTTADIDRLFRVWKGRLGDRRLHPHALRHSFATALVRAGERPDVVMRLMGHRSITTTLRYFHEHGPENQRAVARLRLVPRPEGQREAPG